MNISPANQGDGMGRILIIEDDNRIARVLARLVEELGLQSTIAGSLKEARKVQEQERWDIVLLDLNLPDGNGLSILNDLKAISSAPEIIIITGTGDQEGAKIAFENGAWDFIQKPFMPEEVTLPVSRALEYHKERNISGKPKFIIREGIIGNSSAMQSMLENMAQAAASDINVLIYGETGSGKELFARAIHVNSDRKNGPFVVVDCAAYAETLIGSILFGHEKGAFTGAETFREGLIKQADTGTLFLDEIGELPLNMQKIFLRVLQEKCFRPIGSSHEVKSDFRLIAATHRDMKDMVKNRQFRLDLFHRVNSFTLSLLPLRRHQEDLQDLVLNYLQAHARKTGSEIKGLSPDFIDTLINYDWPGNVRELFNTLATATTNAMESPTLYPLHLPVNVRLNKIKQSWHTEGEDSKKGLPKVEPLNKMSSLKEFRDTAVKNAESQYLHELMRRTQGDIQQAQTLAGLSESRLHALLKKYNTPRFRKKNL